MTDDTDSMMKSREAVKAGLARLERALEGHEQREQPSGDVLIQELAILRAQVALLNAEIAAIQDLHQQSMTRSFNLRSKVYHELEVYLARGGTGLPLQLLSCTLDQELSDHVHEITVSAEHLRKENKKLMERLKEVAESARVTSPKQS